MDQPMSQGSSGGRISIGRETIVEIVAYVGTAVGLAATFIALGRTEDLTDAGALVVMLIVTAVLLGAGLWIGGRASDAFQRMRSVFWFAAVEAWIAVVQLLLGNVFEVEGRASAVLSALLVLAAAAPLWWILRRSLQQILLFVGALGLLVSIIFPQPTFLGIPDLTSTALVIWIFGGLWAFLGVRSILEPRRTAMVLGSLAAIIGPLFFTQSRIVGEVLSLATAIVLLVVGESLRDRAVAGLGIVGVLVVSAVIVGEHFGDSTGGTIAALVVGVVLLVGALFSVPRGGGGMALQPESGFPSSPPERPAVPPAPPPTGWE